MIHHDTSSTQLSIAIISDAVLMLATDSCFLALSTSEEFFSPTCTAMPVWDLPSEYIPQPASAEAFTWGLSSSGLMRLA
jgi:hypothetical protein